MRYQPFGTESDIMGGGKTNVRDSQSKQLEESDPECEEVLGISQFWGGMFSFSCHR